MVLVCVCAVWADASQQSSKVGDRDSGLSPVHLVVCKSCYIAVTVDCLLVLVYDRSNI